MAARLMIVAWSGLPPFTVTRRLLEQTAELAEQIDVQRAKAKADAKGLELKTTHLDADQTALIQASLFKELVRLKAADKLRNL